VTAALVAEPASLEKRLRQGNGRLAGFSNATDLEDVFKRIEAQYIDTEHSESAAVGKARVAVLQAIKHVYLSRLNLGKSLLGYRGQLKADGAWMEVVRVVASRTHSSERTVRNIVSGFGRLSAVLPAVLIEVADSRGIDLSKKKFLPAVKTIEAKIGADDVIDEEQAAQILDSLIPIGSASKTPKPALELKDFALRAAKSIEARVKGKSPKTLRNEVQYIFEVINAKLGSPVRALDQHDSPESVPKPSPNEVGVA
jgi:hypothetical protein